MTEGDRAAQSLDFPGKMTQKGGLAGAVGSDQADALAAALGLRVVRVLSASEESAPVRPFESVQALRAQAAATTPLEGAQSLDACDGAGP